MRTLSNCVPEELRETECLRAKETDEEARVRGKRFWMNVYARNEAFDPEASVRASPDYAFVVRGKKTPYIPGLSATRYWIGANEVIRCLIRASVLFRWDFR